MSFERLLWHGLLQNKLRLAASVAAVASVIVGSMLSLSESERGGRPSYLLLLIAPVVFASCSVGWSERRARSRVLFRFGFSNEQLATLLALEGVAIGGLGAALGTLTNVAFWFGSSNATLHAMPSALRVTAEDLSFTFCASLIVSALAAVGPAYRYARSSFSGDDRS